jgi:hypothetical protein
VETNIADDSAETLLEKIGFFDCPQAKVTARSFASYFRDKPFFDTTTLIPSIKKPTLVVAAELDELNGDLVPKMQQVEARPDLKLDVIEGTDARFTAPYIGQVADRIKLFLDETKG